MTNETNNSLISLGDLSKPADTLIRKVSKAVGGIFAPHQIRRVAKAEAEAAIIRAQMEIQITELHRRAMHRFVEEEAKKQKNIEDIASKAIPHLSAGSDAEKVEDDWVNRAYARLNAGSTCFYVGSSQSIAKRLADHLGYGASGTYALQLLHWAHPLNLRLRFVCAKYPSSIDYSVVQALEDAQWSRKAPMFGRRGRR